MHWTRCDSSAIEAIAYEDGTLHVRMKGGKEFAYKDVPEKVVDEFLRSHSKGGFYNANIRDQYELVE